MNSRGKSLHKFLFSLVALAVCVGMLAGTTYAWFTDTASVTTNQVVSGSLDVALEMSTDGGMTWEDAQGKTLSFSADGEAVLWEPGCTHVLPLVRVVNRGNLALKYQLLLTNIRGNNKLTEAIEWTVNGQDMGSAWSLAPGQASGPVSIQAHMRPDAGNEYQGLTLEGVSVTVYAYQDTVEFDSFGNQYDALAGPLTGKVRLVRQGEAVAEYDRLEDAVAAAQPQDSLELTGNLKATGLALVDKDLTLDGKGYRIVRDGYGGTIVQVEPGVSLDVRDLTLDGSAYSFYIDFSLSYPAVTAESLEGEPQAQASAMISYGTLSAQNVHFVNHCTQVAGAAPLKILQGSAELSGCDFVHNYAHSQGGAVYIGQAFAQGQTDYILDTVRFENCNFSRNYARYGNGGAVFARFAREVRFDGCRFQLNMAASYCAGGGAVLFFRDGIYATENNGLPHMQEIFNDCQFLSNYSGNDGFAIDNECGELTIKGCDFIGNVGLSGSSAVGTVSEMHYTDTTLDTLIQDCLFRGNKGACAVYGDHSSPHDIVIRGCTFESNEGTMGILLYCSDANISDCSFVNESYTTTALDVRAYVGPADGEAYPPPVVNLENVSFSGGTQPRDVLIRRQNHDMARHAPTVNLFGKILADVDVWDAGFLNLFGSLHGDIYSDQVTPPENVVIHPGAVHEGTWQDE